MATQFLPTTSLDRFIKDIAGRRDVVAPVDRDGTTLLSKVEGVESLNLESAALPVVPPKDVFFPQTQVLLRYKTKPTLQIEREGLTGRPLVLFGVKPCDVRSFELLDKVFAQGQFVDASYIERRANTAVIAIGCGKALPTCFCTSMGASPAQAQGADIFLFPFGEGYAVDVQTPRGQDLLDEAAISLNELDTSSLEELAKVKDSAVGSVSLHVDASGVSESLEGLFESEYWKKVSERCIGCGVCSYVCPTCHCFDIQDVSEGNDGYRMRCWDCCMFSDFTRMAGGHNPRPSKSERVRQRFMHKLLYFHVNNNELACVGCGRCLSKCPGGSDITEVIEEVKAGV